MIAHTKRAFTLIELIVVMAIIVTLSVIGFISYNSYVRDSRNSVRQAQLNDIAKAIDQFMFTRGVAPKCNAAATSGVCYFTNNTGYASSKAKGNVVSVSTTGLLPADWALFSFKNPPEDPRGVYYVYAYNGNKYAVFATKELEGGYAAMVKGSLAMEQRTSDIGKTNQDATNLNVIADPTLGLGITVSGETVQQGVIQVASDLPIKFNNFSSTTASVAPAGNAAVPYSF